MKLNHQNIDDYIRKTQKGSILELSKEEWVVLGEFISRNGFSVEFMGRKHTVV